MWSPWQALPSTCDVTLHLLLLFFYRPSTRCTRDVLWKTDFSCPLVCEDSVSFINRYFLSESPLLVMKSSLTLNPIVLLSVFYSCCTLHFSDYINPKCLILKGKKGNIWCFGTLKDGNSSLQLFNSSSVLFNYYLCQIDWHHNYPIF